MFVFPSLMRPLHPARAPALALLRSTAVRKGKDRAQFNSAHTTVSRGRTALRLEALSSPTIP